MNRLPFFSESQKRGLLVLEWLAIFILLGIWIYKSHDSGIPNDSKNGVFQSDSTSFSSRRGNRGKSSSYVYAVEEEPVETFPFDPNTADSTTLLRLGLAPWQVRSIYRYRAKHGRYHTVEDFKRLPGMTNELWNRLAPYVRIGQEFQYVDASENSSVTPTEQPRETSTQQAVTTRDTTVYPEKYKPGTQIDINTADTNQLKKIPGIASYRAAKIVAYRQRLGGFVKKEQVMEACQMPDEVLEWFVVKHPTPQRLNVNKLSLQKLMRHPYISFYQARDIVEYRKGHGDLHSIEELSHLENFTPEKAERLRDYVEF